MNRLKRLSALFLVLLLIATAFSGCAGDKYKEWENIAVRKTLSAGYYHTAALKEDGTVIAKGNNDYGQCETSTWKDIIAVECGAYYTLGLKKDGTVVAVISVTRMFRNLLI